MKGEVYFIQEEMGKRIKIGHTTRPVRDRLKELQTGNSERLFLIGSIPGTKDDEKLVHMKFIEHKIIGEWFHNHVDILVFIKKSSQSRLHFLLEDEEEILKEDDNSWIKDPFWAEEAKEEEVEDEDMKMCYNVSTTARKLNMSRARFYQLLDLGVLPKPQYSLTNLPYYDNYQMKIMQKVMISGIGINGEVCMFYDR